MKLRTLLTLVLALALMAAFTACSQSSSDTTAQTDPILSPENPDENETASNPDDTEPGEDEPLEEADPDDVTLELEDESTGPLFAVASSSITDIAGHKYETEIREVLDAGWWKLSSTATKFSPNSYLQLSTLVNVVLRATGRYDAAMKFTGGVCPSYPTLSYAINAGILVYSTCPSPTSYPTLNLTVKALSRAFKKKDVAHSDFFDDMVASYSGPNIGSLSSPYGVTRDFFKFAYEIDALVAWSSSFSASSTTYGSRKVTRGEAAAFVSRILGYELPDSIEGPDYWVPEVGTSWYIQLQDTVNTGKNVKVYDIDLFDNPKSVIDTLHSRGVKVICYFNAGSYEDWRPDAYKFPSSVLGASNGWAGEYWLDLRRLDVLGPIMKARMDLAVQKGCDALDLDNMDGYTHTYSGFPITYADQIRYNRYMADAAHARGLAIGLKNDLEQVEDLVDYYDFAINESCYEYKECHYLDAFVDRGKAVLGIEYEVSPSAFCHDANARGFSFIYKDYDLGSGGSNVNCWNY